MPRSPITIFAEPLAALCLFATLAGCSFADDTLLPSLAGEDPRGRPRPAAATEPAPGATQDATQAAATSADEPMPAAADIRRLKADLQRLQDNVGRLDVELERLREGLAQSEAGYRGRVTGIEGERRAGAAPGDPKLVADASTLQGQVEQTAGLLSRLSALSTRAASESTFGSYLLQSIRATGTRGDLSDGDRRQLQGIEGDAARAAASADRLVSAAAEQIAEGSRRLAAERRETASFAGAAASGATPVAAPATPRAAPRPSESSAAERRPFVTIRFDRPNVAYETALREAVDKARQRRPDVAFDLVAVTPPGVAPDNAAAAKRNVESVFRSLLGMGIPADRIRLAAQTRQEVETQEIRLYVR